MYSAVKRSYACVLRLFYTPRLAISQYITKKLKKNTNGISIEEKLVIFLYITTRESWRIKSRVPREVLLWRRYNYGVSTPNITIY
jgi:hypothetical protein